MTVLIPSVVHECTKWLCSLFFGERWTECISLQLMNLSITMFMHPRTSEEEEQLCFMAASEDQYDKCLQFKQGRGGFWRCVASRGKYGGRWTLDDPACALNPPENLSSSPFSFAVEGVQENVHVELIKMQCDNLQSNFQQLPLSPTGVWRSVDFFPNETPGHRDAQFIWLYIHKWANE